MFVTIRGQLHYLWRAVDQDGDTIDILVQKRRNKRAAKRFFRKLLKGQCASPRRMVTDKLKSYSAAKREVMPSVPHCTDQYANNRANYPMNPPGFGNDRCGGSNLPARRSDFSQCMAL